MLPMEVEAEDEAGQPLRFKGRHIRKRSLKNKALSVSFNEKDLKDYVSGFHKRKKKRRKEAKQKLEEAQRRKRIEARKRRKLEKEYVQYGGAPPPASDPGPDELDEDYEQDEGNDSIASVSGTTTYDHWDTKVTVITSAISHEEELRQCDINQAAVPRSIVGTEKKHSIPVSWKKPFKRVAKYKPRAKPQNKRDRKNAKKKNRKVR